MTVTIQDRLNEYKELLTDIYTTCEYGQPFVQAVHIAVTMQHHVPSRNSYIGAMGKTFNIPTEKVERVIALLPA